MTLPQPTQSNTHTHIITRQPTHSHTTQSMANICTRLCMSTHSRHATATPRPPGPRTPLGGTHLQRGGALLEVDRDQRGAAPRDGGPDLVHQRGARLLRHHLHVLQQGADVARDTQHLHHRTIKRGRGLWAGQRGGSAVREGPAGPYQCSCAAPNAGQWGGGYCGPKPAPADPRAGSPPRMPGQSPTPGDTRGMDSCCPAFWRFLRNPVDCLPTGAPQPWQQEWPRRSEQQGVPTRIRAICGAEY